MGRRRAPAESEGRISDRRTPDAKIRKSYFLRSEDGHGHRSFRTVLGTDKWDDAEPQQNRKGGSQTAEHQTRRYGNHISSSGTPKRSLRATFTRQKGKKASRGWSNPAGSSGGKTGIGLAMQETFTHSRILYTLFDSFVNHISNHLSR